MNKEFLSYEQALALKELGFDEPCIGYYNHDGSHFFKFKPRTDDKNLTKAPLYQQAFRWFREKHGLGHMISGKGFENFLMYLTNKDGIITIANAKTYEEAEQACLDKLIEIVKNGKHI